VCACEHASELRSVTPNCTTIHEQLTLLYQSLVNLLSAFTRIVISMAFSLSRPPTGYPGYHRRAGTFSMGGRRRHQWEARQERLQCQARWREIECNMTARYRGMNVPIWCID